MNDTIDKSVLIAAARKNFWAFCVFWDYDFFYNRRPFLYKVAKEFQRIEDKEINTLAVSMPPRSGKSYISSLFVVWVIGLHPKESVMRNCCTSTLYNKFSYDARDMVRDDRFKQVFPSVKLAGDKQSVAGWNVDTATQVTYFGNGVGGTIIGFGASILAMTDDLYKGHEDAMSETIRDKTQRWYESSHLSRIEKGCPKIDIGTRWCKDDVIGKNETNNVYDSVVRIAAFTEDKQTFCDDVKSTEEYLEIERLTDPFIFASEYMQEPVDSVGLVFPHSQLIKYKEKNNNVGYRVAYIDTADGGSDYFSMPIVEYYAEENKGYLIDVVFNLDELHINESLINAKAIEHNLDYIVVETNKEGGYLINNLRKTVKAPIYGKFNTANKVSRIIGQGGYIKQYIEFKDNPTDIDYQKFMQQLTSFLRTGKSKHDDAPDSLAGLMAFLRMQFSF